MKPMQLPGPKAKDVINRDRKYVSGSYPRAYPFVMDHGKGAEVWDVDGNRFLDFAAGIAVTSTGHSHPEVVKAIKKQVDKFIHISSDFYHPIWVELAETLDRIAPFQNENAVSFMTNSGTESVEAAIKLARYHTGRSRFIGFLGGFHGRTLGSLAFTASKPVYREGFFPLMDGVIHAPFPDPFRPLLKTNPGEDYGKTVVRFIEEELMTKVVPPNDVAGIMVEPIQGEGGYIVPAQGFFPALRELCDRHQILLIVDEVQSGMGRTGKMWAVENFGVEPDIVCAAKGIASGMPLGAMIARESVMTWPKGAHGNTYGGNPVAAAAGLATIRLIENGLMENALTIGKYMKDALEEIQSAHETIGEVRGLGLMLGVDFVKDKTSREPFKKLRDKVEKHAFEHGLITLGCGASAIRFAPPLIINKSEVDEGLSIFDHAVNVAEKEMT
ncbi:MAG: acetyl ornithine aminotransferase family protein [Anaerolineales bacterium]